MLWLFRVKIDFIVLLGSILIVRCIEIGIIILDLVLFEFDRVMLINLFIVRLVDLCIELIVLLVKWVVFRFIWVFFLGSF